MARQLARGRPRAWTSVLTAAVALIAAAGVILFVLGQQSPQSSPRPHASPSSSGAVAAAVAALLRQGTPDTARGYWEKPSAALEAAAAARRTPSSVRSAHCS